MVKQSYKYVEVPISPSVAKSLILELLSSGSLMERKIILSKMEELHLKRGGIKSTSNPINIIKKALSDLKKDQLVESPRIGFWKLRINSDSKGDINKGEEENIEIDEISDIQDTKDVENKYNKISYIYVYYFPAYKELALLKNLDIWQCKIGRSDAPYERIKSQISSNTSHSEIPSIEMICETSNSIVLESILHNILSMRNRRILDAGGKEWFRTNPDEVRKIIQVIENIVL